MKSASNLIFSAAKISCIAHLFKKSLCEEEADVSLPALCDLVLSCLEPSVHC